MRLARVRPLVLALGLGLAALAPAAAEDFQPPSPDADRALYQPSRAGFEHYIQDELQRLIAGQRWEWSGNSFEAVRLHRIHRAALTRDRQANRDYAAPVRGWAVVTLHVRVNGRLTAARTELNASYVWQPGGWAWEQALLYLGNGDSYDFVTGEVK